MSQFVDNLIVLARSLRRLGLPIGTDRIITLTEALQHVDLSSACIRQKVVEGRAAVFRAAHPTVDVLGSRPGAGCDVLTEFLKLIFGFLPEGADASVNTTAHLFPSIP